MDVGVDREEIGYDDVTYEVILEKLTNGEYISLDTSNAMAPFVMDDIRNISQFKKINPTIQSKVIFGVASLMQYLHSLKIRAFSLKYEKIIF